MSMRVLFPVGALALIGGCYRPSIESCQYECFEDRCPDGLVCNAGGMCARSTDEVCSPGPGPDSACGWPATSNVDPCAASVAPGADWRISNNITIDTDDMALAIPGFPSGGVRSISMQSSGADVALLAVADLRLDEGATAMVVGNRPLVILVHGTATIEGAIRYTFRDPASSCESTGGTGTMSTVPGGTSGGGGGGGFGQRMGRATGGAPGGDSGDGGQGGAGGPPTGNAALVPLRGGCAGGRGGGAFGQPGAPGGGAIQISAREGIRVTGRVEANGGAPLPAAIVMDGGGGGGGGAGGGILLESQLIELGGVARLCANGGGGGAVDSTNTSAEPGQCSNSPATGGGITSRGGNGGSRDADPTAGAGFATSESGGGGGGGGVGRIRINGRVRGVPAVCSPGGCEGAP